MRKIGEYMRYGGYFHLVIIAYLTFIFMFLGGCGYKTKPFYTKDAQEVKQEIQGQDSMATQRKEQNRTLFQSIDSTPTPSYEEEE